MTDMQIRLFKLELAGLGYHDADYMPEMDRLAIFPADDNTPFITELGDVYFKSEHSEIAHEQLMPLVHRVNDMIAAWNNTSHMVIEDLSHYHKLAEWGNIVFAARDDGELGLHFVTWQYSPDRRYVEHGHYTTDYAGGKEDFAIRAGLVPENKLLTEEEAREIHSALMFRGQNDTEMSWEDEEQLRKIADKIERAYPESNPELSRVYVPEQVEEVEL